MHLDPTVQVACITAVSAILVALITVLGARMVRSTRATEKAIGTPNGHGTLVQMLETVLVKIGQIEANMAAHEVRDAERFQEIWDRFED